MLEMKIIKGKRLIIMLGTKMLVKIMGKRIPTSLFLKNSISSNRFKIIPKQ
tara:strand:- start:477 stop:629 length:153 start_codon:yes stop_codon:yes gene_type:complete